MSVAHAVREDHDGLITSRLSGRCSSPALGAYRQVKRTLDLTLVLATAPAWLLALAACWVAVKAHEPKARAFFVEQRTGGTANGSYHQVSDHGAKRSTMQAALMHLNERNGPHFKLKNDPRVTSVGRHLRRFHRMSFLSLSTSCVATCRCRPPTTGATPRDYVLWHTERFETSPGMTCLWQLAAESHPSFDDRMRLDIHMPNRSLSLDLEILVRTVGHVFRGLRMLKGRRTCAIDPAWAPAYQQARQGSAGV